MNFAGTGSDENGSDLPASAFHWTITFLHEDHTHQFFPAIDNVKSGSVVLPTTGETDTRQGYRVTLAVTDANGLTGTTSVDIKPNLANLTVSSNIPGISLSVDNQPHTAPYTFSSVAGMGRTITAPQSQVVNGTAYQFVGWSDQGAYSHNVTTPLTDTSYTATYQVAPPHRRRPMGMGLQGRITTTWILRGRR